jgi:undecaprenyl-diphosphatase
MSLITALILGIIQGGTELFPFSSLGILVIVPHFLAVRGLTGTRYLPFLVALHVGTALALIGYFWRDWVAMVRGWFRTWEGEESPEGRLFWLIILATIPAGLVGLALKHKLTALFGHPLPAAVFLLVNGGIMALGDRVARRVKRRQTLEALTAGQSLTIGLWQILALIPGLSRSGSTITGGVALGLSFEDAAHFSFLLATPIILAAGLVELPKLHGGLHGLMVPALVGGVAAAVVALLSTRFLMGYFRVNNLKWLAVCSAILGVAGLVLVH